MIENVAAELMGPGARCRKRHSGTLSKVSGDLWREHAGLVIPIWGLAASARQATKLD